MQVISGKELSENGLTSNYKAMEKQEHSEKPISRWANRGLYHDSFPGKVYKLMLLGATNDTVADFFEISVPTLNSWIREKAEFTEAMRRGRVESDMRVAKSLYRRATGYSVTETHKTKGINARGLPFETEKTETKHYPPDVKAIVFWLSNRQKSIWANTTKTEVSIKQEPIDLSVLTPEQEKLVKSIALKQVSTLNGISQN